MFEFAVAGGQADAESIREGKADRESASTRGAGCHTDPSAVRLGDRVADGESQPNTRHPVGSR